VKAAPRIEKIFRPFFVGLRAVQCQIDQRISGVHDEVTGMQAGRNKVPQK
jgi:hypothetical protein